MHSFTHAYLENVGTLLTCVHGEDDCPDETGPDGTPQTSEEPDRTGRAETARRARVILLLAGGATWNAVCHAVGCSRGFVATWRRRFAAERLAGLYRRHRGQVPLRTDGNPYPGSHAAGAGRRLHALEHPQAGGAARGQSHAGHRHVREIAQFGVQLARGPIDWLAWGGPRQHFGLDSIGHFIALAPRVTGEQPRQPIRGNA
ncbi:MAG: helix-turn-helix domain-containing protein, partial [Nitrospira sp.]|nr:helix-turn-helix domain-containing protein [Nitrospira sp.]